MARRKTRLRKNLRKVNHSRRVNRSRNVNRSRRVNRSRNVNRSRKLHVRGGGGGLDEAIENLNEVCNRVLGLDLGPKFKGTLEKVKESIEAKNMNGGMMRRAQEGIGDGNAHTGLTPEQYAALLAARARVASQPPPPPGVYDAAAARYGVSPLAFGEGGDPPQHVMDAADADWERFHREIAVVAAARGDDLPGGMQFSPVARDTYQRVRSAMESGNDLPDDIINTLSPAISTAVGRLKDAAIAAFNASESWSGESVSDDSTPAPEPSFAVEAFNGAMSTAAGVLGQVPDSSTTGEQAVGVAMVETAENARFGGLQQQDVPRAQDMDPTLATVLTVLMSLGVVGFCIGLVRAMARRADNRRPRSTAASTTAHGRPGGGGVKKGGIKIMSSETRSSDKPVKMFEKSGIMVNKDFQDTSHREIEDIVKLVEAIRGVADHLDKP